MATSNISKNTTKPLKRPQRRFIDLHVHSKYSDGDFEVNEIIDICLQRDLKAVAITDHDTIDGFNDGKEYAEESGLELVPGVEISAYYDGSEIHILGYLFDPTNLNLNMKLSELQQKRKTRAKKIVQKLNSHGIDISMERVFEKVKGTSIGRPHIAAVMLEEEYISTFSEAFEKHLSSENIKEFETEKLTPIEAMDMIKQAGGVTAMAHPAETNRDDLIEPLVQAGLSGIETYCNGADRSTVSRYRNIAKKFNLIFCGGSDFHNDKGGGKFLPGCVKVPYASLTALKRLRDSKA
ncbi:PHP domain-containing protein [Fibrobacterota bacterium]